MSDGHRTQKRRIDAAPRNVARYGDAGGRTMPKLGVRNGRFNFSFSSPGLALIGLRRRDSRDRPRGRLA